MKKALLLCASHNDLGLVRALRKLGYYIIVTGRIKNAPGEEWCDKYIQADYSQKELILKIANEEKIDAIVQCCNDFGVYTAAYVAEKLGLPGYDSYETTLLLHNKDRFKHFALQNGIFTPQAKSFDDKKDAMEYMGKCTCPVIVKPVDASAGNGISKVDDKEDAIEAIEFAFEKSKDGRIVVETFINGSQHGFCTFLKSQKVVAVCSNNEYSLENKYRVEIDTFPADNFSEVRDILVSEIEKIAGILNLQDGIFHLQYIFDGNKPQIIEVMRRILGNMYHVPGNMLTGMDWEYWETRAKCGLSLSDMPTVIKQEGFFAYKTLLAQENGKVRGYRIPDSYKRYIFDEFFLKGKGDEITHYLSEPAGFLFMMFPSQADMKDILINHYASNLVMLEEKSDE